MDIFKNFVLRREVNKILDSIKTLECGHVGGYSIEITTDDSISFDSYLYQGNSAESDRNHDFEILNKLFLEKTSN